MRKVIDTARYQIGLDFGEVYRLGYRDGYVKMGGDNDDPTYITYSYAPQVDGMRRAGFEHVGHYWIPNADPSDADPIDTPEQQAAFFVDGLHDWRPDRDFVVWDNENLDGARRWDDHGVASAILETLRRNGTRGRQQFVYTNLSDARAHPWPETLATGAMFIIAAPSYPPGELPHIPTIPAERIVGHQHGTRNFGGIITDVNVFTDNAFDYGGPIVIGAYNPFRNVRITGTWEDHGSYSAGGTDLPLAYGTTIPAPAAGILRNSGGSGEWQCGWVGSAGRRSILSLDVPLPRLVERKLYPPEGEGPLVAIVFQHQSEFQDAGWYPMTHPVGWSGASAYGQNYGGQVHLHWHGLNEHGQRLRLESFLPASGTAGGGTTPIENESEDDMPTLVVSPGGQNLIVGDELFALTAADVAAIKGAPTLNVSQDTHWQIIDRYSKRGKAADLPVIVGVRAGEGNGTIYAFVDGTLLPLADPTTVQELESKGATIITLSQAEVENILNRQ
jgi:hypothetical protein